MGNSVTTPIELIFEKLEYDGTIQDYNRVVNSLSEKDRKQLGKYYDLWKAGCEYKFLTDGKLDKDSYITDIISHYNQLDAEIYVQSDEELVKQLIAMAMATKFPKYNETIMNISNQMSSTSPLKKSVDIKMNLNV